MSRKTVYINLDMSNPTHAAVADLFEQWGRNKNAFLMEALRPYISKFLLDDIHNTPVTSQKTTPKHTQKSNAVLSPAKAVPAESTTPVITADPAAGPNEPNEGFEENREACFSKEQLADIAAAGVNIEEMSADRFEEFKQYVVEFGMKAENAALASSFTK